MSVLLYDETTQAFKESSNPLLYSGGGYDHALGKVYDKANEAWVDAWQEGLRDGYIYYYGQGGFTVESTAGTTINFNANNIQVQGHSNQTDGKIITNKSRNLGLHSNMRFYVDWDGNYAQLKLNVDFLDENKNKISVSTSPTYGASNYICINDNGVGNYVSPTSGRQIVQSNLLTGGNVQNCRYIRIKFGNNIGSSSDAYQNATIYQMYFA